jgi:hypothetical protein
MMMEVIHSLFRFIGFVDVEKVDVSISNVIRERGVRKGEKIGGRHLRREDIPWRDGGRRTRRNEGDGIR